MTREETYRHLLDRNLLPSLYLLWIAEGAVTFPLWNLSGQMIGYQTYFPGGSKKIHSRGTNDFKPGARYHTWITKQHKSKGLGMWGLETYNWNKEILFITEGIFDACRIHNYGLPAIATLGNNPKTLPTWLGLIPRYTVAICDNDIAGKALAKYTDKHIFTESHDLGDAPEVEVHNLIQGILL